MKKRLDLKAWAESAAAERKARVQRHGKVCLFVCRILGWMGGAIAGHWLLSLSHDRFGWLREAYILVPFIVLGSWIAGAWLGGAGSERLFFLLKNRVDRRRQAVDPDPVPSDRQGRGPDPKT